MRLQSGARIGPYEVVDALGAGGMGEVYRARDTRLDRSVAIKVMPNHATARAELRERFEREARAISNLGHPNICALYDVGDHDGMPYLVMELLEGEALSTRLRRGAMPISEVIRYGSEIAAALGRAHECGIVHRDLKPANVMITRDGAKLVDFGLARQLLAVSGDDVTMKHALTADGMIVGTLQYMAPEQLEGDEADARSDIFALGCVLFEMVTGQRAFSGSSRATIISAILSSSPRPINPLQSPIPSALERIINVCLEKNRDHRWQNAADVARMLRELVISDDRARPLVPPARRAGAIGAAAVIGLLIGAAAMLALRPATAERKPVAFALAPDPLLYSANALSTTYAVSPDGSKLAIVRDEKNGRRLWLRRFDNAEFVPLPATAGALGPVWSSDGKSIAFAADRMLKRLRLGSAAAEVVCPLSGIGFTASWNDDDEIIFAELTGRRGIHRINLRDNSIVRVADVPGAVEVYSPRFLPDGERFLFNAIEKQFKTSLWIGSTDGTPPRKVHDEASAAAVAGDWVIFNRSGTLVAQKLDPDAAKLLGTPAVIADGVFLYRPVGVSLHSASPTALAYTPARQRGRIEWYSRDGRNLGTVISGRDVRRFRLSPDGRRIAVSISDDRSATEDIFIQDLTRGALTRVTSAPTDDSSPVWFPDGKRIVHPADVDGPPHLVVRTVGVEGLTPLLPPSVIQIPSDVTPDGKNVFFTRRGRDTGSDIWVVNVASRQARAWLATPFVESRARVSPDGRWVAYISNESGSTEVYLRSISGGLPYRISTGGGSSPAWTRGGSEIVFVTGDNSIAAVEVSLQAPEPVISVERRLFTVARQIGEFEVTPDGERFLVGTIDRSIRDEPVQILLNWQQALSRDGRSTAAQ